MQLAPHGIQARKTPENVPVWRFPCPNSRRLPERDESPGPHIAEHGRVRSICQIGGSVSPADPGYLPGTIAQRLRELLQHDLGLPVPQHLSGE